MMNVLIAFMPNARLKKNVPKFGSELKVMLCINCLQLQLEVGFGMTKRL